MDVNKSNEQLILKAFEMPTTKQWSCTSIEKNKHFGTNIIKIHWLKNVFVIVVMMNSN